MSRWQSLESDFNSVKVTICSPNCVSLRTGSGFGVKSTRRRNRRRRRRARRDEGEEEEEEEEG